MSATPTGGTYDVAGLNVVVTGGNRGIGLALGLGLARAGANIAVWARDAAKSEDAVAQLMRFGGKAVAVSCDITDERAVARAMDQTVDALGPLGSLIANAGIADATPFTEEPLTEWRRIMSTNLDGAFLTTREAARRFVEQESGGSLVVVSSMVSRYGAAGQVAYATSKTGLIGLGRSLAVEFARHRVRCNVLIPGWTKTDMNADLRENDRFMKATTARTPVRRWADAAEFEAVAPFLVDPSLTFHTGNEIVVDGGYSIF